MKIFCIGRNYAEHAKELGNDIPDKPVIFMKPATACLKSPCNFFHPEFSNDIHYEVELVIKIGKNGKHIDQKFALSYCSEITVGIDFTARDWQNTLKKQGHPWEIAKAFDNSAIIGSFLPIKNFNDLQNINFSLIQNRNTVQNSNSKFMIFNISKIISYISTFFTLQQGDLIFTGTPQGVGKINISDVLEAFIEDQKLLTCTVK